MESQRSAYVAGLFDRVADVYEGTGVPWFTPIARRLVEAVGPRPGQRAIDLGCGRGAALFALAEAVGPTGRVTGVDVSPGMVEAVRADAAAQGLSTVDVQLMDVGRLDLDRLRAGRDGRGFDVAVASMVVFFLPDPVAGLRSWRELLAPGGRLGISTMGPRDPGWRALDDIVRPFVAPAIIQARTGPLVRRLATEDGVRDVLTEAGYRSVRTSTVDMEAVFDGAEQWREWGRSHASRMMWESVPDAAVPEILAAARRHLEGLRGPDGKIRLGQRILLTVGEP
jgi:ubiquinone/menaquinone biosynthesis C-methylase UbiE